jgi:hypothetical protein
MAAFNRTITDNLLKEFVSRELVDHLTYVRDYLINKSINFMLFGKNMNGKTVAVGQFVYSPSSNYLFLKDFRVVAGEDQKMLIGFMVTSAREYMASYGFNPKAIITSPSVRTRNVDQLRFMTDMGMQFLSIEPKHDVNYLGSKNPVSVFALGAQKGVSDMRVVLVEGYGKGPTRVSKSSLSKFLKDLKDEDDLSCLLMLFGDSKFTITLKTTAEVGKLTSLLSFILPKGKKG